MVLCVALVALAVRALHVAFIHGHPFWDLGEQWPSSDMYQYAAWARHLASGDWLDRNTFRAWFDWQEAIAPQEVWNSWYGAHVYYQPPLYPYLAAIFLAFTGSLDAFRFAQVAIGALNCALVALLAVRLYGRTAGWVAGLAAALYAPWILYDAELLRGTFTLATQALLLLALTTWHWTLPDEAPSKGRLRAALCGVALGVSWLTDPVIISFAPVAGLWMIWSCRSRDLAWRRAAESLGLLIAGAALAVLPLAARNAAAGAPLLSSTTRGPLAFVMGNAPDAQPAGATIPPSTPGILRRAGYTMSGTIRETIALYRGQWGGLIAHQWSKLKALWGNFEIPDNPSFYYATHISPALRFGLRFLPVASVGLVGIALSLFASAKGRDPLRALLPLFLVSAMGIFLLAHVVSRYRQPMLLALFPLAGYAVAWAVSRGWGGRAGVAVAVALIALLLPWGPTAGYGYNRPAEFIMTARIHAQRGEVDEAVAELQSAMDLARREDLFRPAVALLHYETGMIEQDAGRGERAAASYRAALQEDPGFAAAAEALRAMEMEMRAR